MPALVLGEVYPTSSHSYESYGFEPQMQVIVDCEYTFEEAIAGSGAPSFILNALELITVTYYSMDQQLHQGQILIHHELVEEVRQLFFHLREQRFPIEKVIPIVAYNWDDRASMADNNTSGFNYRVITNGSQLSMHAFGRAIDINPRLNPYIHGQNILPENGAYDPSIPGTITEDNEWVQLLCDHGWSWGGHWRSLKDYQHFEKRLSP